jgi:hypothetical protein
MPGGEMLPHMSARMRTQTIDALFVGSGGFDRALAWIESSDEAYTEFFKIWAKGAVRPTAVEHSMGAGVEEALKKLDEAERRSDIVDVTPQVVDG